MRKTYNALILLTILWIPTEQIWATVKRKNVTAKAADVTCSRLMGTEGATALTTQSQRAIIQKSIPTLSRTDIRHSPWIAVSLHDIKDYQLFNNPDSHSQILAAPNSNHAQTREQNLISWRERAGALAPYSADTTRSAYASTLQLQRLGTDRYFQFQPSPFHSTVIARILDIESDGRSLMVLAEWIDEKHKKTIVGVLTKEELLTIHRPAVTDFANIAEEAFAQLIDPAALNLRTEFDERKLPILFHEMTSNRIQHFDSSSYFKYAAHDLHPEEPDSTSAYYKMADQAPTQQMIEELNPNYYYNWIINENGELQISVHAQVRPDTDHVPRPSLYLLSKGRGIMAGGYMQFKNNHWQVMIDADGGNYGVFSTQDVVIDDFDYDIQSGRNILVSRYFQPSTKMPVIPYLHHLEDYVVLIQEAFYTSTGLMPEVSKFWNDLNKWHMPAHSQSRASNNPTTAEEARELNKRSRLYGYSDTETDSYDSCQGCKGKKGRAESNHRRSRSAPEESQPSAPSQKLAPWSDPNELIAQFRDNFDAQISDLHTALWVLKVEFNDIKSNSAGHKKVRDSYVRLNSQYHPDKLIESGTDKDKVLAAQQLTTIITRAWKTYKTEKDKGAFD